MSRIKKTQRNVYFDVSIISFCFCSPIQGCQNLIYKLVLYSCKMYKDTSKTRNVQAHVNLIRDTLSALTLQTDKKFELRWLAI